MTFLILFSTAFSLSEAIPNPTPGRTGDTIPVLQSGPTGPTGPVGPQGAVGPVGPANPFAYYATTTTTTISQNAPFTFDSHIGRGGITLAPDNQTFSVSFSGYYMISISVIIDTFLPNNVYGVGILDLTSNSLVSNASVALDVPFSFQNQNLFFCRTSIVQLSNTHQYQMQNIGTVNLFINGHPSLESPSASLMIQFTGMF